MKKNFKIVVINVNVLVVFFVCGFLKNGIVLLIVLIFVKEEELDEKVCKIKVIEIFGIMVFGKVVVFNGCVLVIILNSLIIISKVIIVIKLYIGNIKNEVDFFRFFKFIKVINIIILIEIVIWWLYNVGIVDIIVFVFVEIEMVIVSI